MRTDVFPSLTPRELAVAGQALFGPDWRAELAPVLGVTEQQLARVLAGKAQAPQDWRAKLIAAAQDIAMRALGAASDLMWQDEAAQSAADVQAVRLV